MNILSYKHDGELHRVWKDVVKIHESKDMIVLINNEVEVIDGDGWKWKTREPAVCYFFKDHWFNVICMLRGQKIYYYCNLSSPYVVDDEGLKYIDYDLDIKLFPDGEVLELDRDEYDFNIKNLHYSDKLIHIIDNNMQTLLSYIEEKKEPFDGESVRNWYEKYLNEFKSQN